MPAIKVIHGYHDGRMVEFDAVLVLYRALFRLCYLDRIDGIYWARAADRCVPSDVPSRIGQDSNQTTSKGPFSSVIAGFPSMS